MGIETMWTEPRYHTGSYRPNSSAPQGRVSAGSSAGGQFTEKYHSEAEIDLEADGFEREEEYEPDFDVDSVDSIEQFRDSYMSELRKDMSRTGYLKTKRSHRPWRQAMVANGHFDEVSKMEAEALEAIRTAERSGLPTMPTGKPVTKLTISFERKGRSRMVEVETSGYHPYSPNHKDNQKVINAAYIKAHVALGIRQNPMEFHAVKESIRSALSTRRGDYDLKERRGSRGNTEYDLLEIKTIPS